MITQQSYGTYSELPKIPSDTLNCNLLKNQIPFLQLSDTCLNISFQYVPAQDFGQTGPDRPGFRVGLKYILCEIFTIFGHYGKALSGRYTKLREPA